MSCKVILCSIYVIILSMIFVSSNAERKAIEFAPEVGAVINEAIKKCSKREGSDPNYVNIIKEGSYKTDDNFKNQVHCVYFEAGFAYPNGHVKIEKAASIFPKEYDILSIFKNCDKQGDNPADTTFLSLKCFQETSPVLMSLPNM